MLVGNLVAERRVQARRLKVERLQIKRQAATALGRRLELAYQPCAEAAPSVRRMHPQLLQFAAQAPRAADGPADDRSVAKTGGAGQRSNLVQWGGRLVRLPESFVDGGGNCGGRLVVADQ